MGILGDLFNVGAAVVGHKSDKKKNKRAAEELALQKKLADQQIRISDYIQATAEELKNKGSTTVDPYGSTSGYDPVTGTWRSTLGAIPARNQAAADEEEFLRNTYDQQLRRKGLSDVENMRSRSGMEASTALTDLNNFKRGIGKVDPALLASTMRLDRQGAVNAGFDDAERAASTLQLRTGSSAVGDALKRLAVDRVRAQSQIGNPEAEALQLAEGVNTNRLGGLQNLYKMFSDEGKQMYDTSFAPAPYADLASARAGDAMKFDLSKYDTAMGGSGTAGAGIGAAAGGIRQGYQLSEANRIHAPTAALLRGVGANADKLGADLVKAISGLGG